MTSRSKQLASAILKLNKMAKRTSEVVEKMTPWFVGLWVFAMGAILVTSTLGRVVLLSMMLFIFSMILIESLWNSLTQWAKRNSK